MSLTRRELFELAGALALPRPQSADARSLDDTAQRAADVIKGYSAEGMHRTGTAVDRASADRLLALARAAGASPSLAPFDLSRVDPTTSFLEIDGRRVEGLPMFDAAFTPADGIAGAIGPIDGDRPIAWTRIAPNGEAALRRVRQASRHRAIVVATMGGKPGLCPVNAASFTEPFGPPVLQVGSEHLAAMEEASGAGRSVRVVAHVSRTPAAAFNVVAEVRGTQPQSPPVCVMTPRSGWYANASERGGGLACWLEAIRAVAASQVPAHRQVRGVERTRARPPWPAFVPRSRSRASRRGALVWVHLGANIGTSTGDTGMTAPTTGCRPRPSARSRRRARWHPRGAGGAGWRRGRRRSARRAAGSSRSSAATTGFTIPATSGPPSSTSGRWRGSRARLRSDAARWRIQRSSGCRATDAPWLRRLPMARRRPQRSHRHDARSADGRRARL